MGAIIDLIIVLIIALTVFFAVRRGFVKTALGTLGFFIAAALALCFCSSFGDTLQKSSFGSRIESFVDTAVDKVVDSESYKEIFGNNKDGADEEDETEGGETEGSETEASGAEGSETEESETEVGEGEESGDKEDRKSALETLFSIFGAEDVYNSISEGYHEHCEEGLESARQYIKQGITEKALPFCCDILAFLILFFGLRLLIKLAEIIIGRLTELPVLKQADKLLGVIVGVLLSLLRVYLFCVVLKLLIPAAKTLNIDWIANINLDSSILFGFFDSWNFLSNLI